MKNFKEREVVKLVTADKSEISLGNMGSGMIRHTNIRPDYTKRTYYYLYVLSDDKIREGDWIFWNNKIVKAINTAYYSSKKIIATNNINLLYSKETDTLPSLPNQLPKLSDNFIDFYVKEFNNSNIIEKVLVEYYTDLDKDDLGMWIGGTSKDYLLLNNNNEINIELIKKDYNFTKDELITFMKRFKEDCELFSDTPFKKKYGSTLTLHEMEEKWFQENL